MRKTILTLLCLNVFFLHLFVGQIEQAQAEEQESKTIQVALNIGAIVEFAEDNKEVAKMLQAAIREISDGSQIENLDDAIKAANEVVGMDIRTDAHSLNLHLGSGLSLSGNFSLDVAPISVVLHTAKQGNLQGLLLMSPTYSSKESNGKTIHVMNVDDQQNVYIQFFKSGSGVFTVASLDADRLEAVGKEVSSRQISPSDYNDDELFRATVGKDTFKEVSEELIGENSPPANILRNLMSDMKELELVISREGNGIQIDLASSVNSKDKAEQQYQAILGGKAIAKMFLESEKSHKKTDQLVEILNTLEVTLDDNNVNVRLKVPSMNAAMELIEF